jgi:hypothetical protein
MQHTEQQFVLFSAILSDVEGAHVLMTCSDGAVLVSVSAFGWSPRVVALTG